MVDADHGRVTGDGPTWIGRSLVGPAVGNRGAADAGWFCHGRDGCGRSLASHGAFRKPEVAGRLVIVSGRQVDDRSQAL